MTKNTLEAKQRQSQLYQQQENASILRTVNWSAELDTDTISASEWKSEYSGASIADESNTANTASARVSGDVGKHTITNKITTSSGNIMERQLIIKIHDNNADAGQDYC